MHRHQRTKHHEIANPESLEFESEASVQTPDLEHHVVGLS